MGRAVQAGDWVVLWSSHETLSRFKTEAGLINQSKAGKFWHDDIIGSEYGSRVAERKGTKTAVILPMSAELRTLSLEHRTQVVYAPDLAWITMLLEIEAGSIVVETGTGSGSATVSFARSVGPKGRVHTFEFHSQREEFAALRLEDRIICSNRNVYVDGFGGEGGLEDASADAVFIDLPQPWLAIKHAHTILKAHRRVVIFSPCNEQVQEAASELRQFKYQDIECQEVIVKPWGVWTESDAARRLQRTEKARLANLEANRTKKVPVPIVPVETALFPISKTTFYQLPLRGHTGYILSALKPPADEASVE